MKIVLVGGPLCGKQRDLAQAPSTFVWVQATGPEGYAPVRFFKGGQPGRHLYRDDRRFSNGTRHYLYAGHSYAHCCGGFHSRRGDGGFSCAVCGDALAPER